jgi:hypothetical protein
MLYCFLDYSYFTYHIRGDKYITFFIICEKFSFFIHDNCNTLKQLLPTLLLQIRIMRISLSAIKDVASEVRIWQKYSCFSTIKRLLHHPMWRWTRGSHRIYRIKVLLNWGSMFSCIKCSINSKSNRRQWKIMLFLREKFFR